MRRKVENPASNSASSRRTPSSGEGGSGASRRPLQDVPDTADRSDERVAGRVFQLPAKVPDVHVHDVRSPGVVVVPDVQEDPIPGHHGAGPPHEELEERERLGGEGYGPSGS